MTPLPGQENADGSAKMVAETRKRAVNCNLCQDLVAPDRDPFCVAACPHDAAFRWTGEDLLARVAYRESVREDQVVAETKKSSFTRINLL